MYTLYLFNTALSVDGKPFSCDTSLLLSWHFPRMTQFCVKITKEYTLSEAWSGVNWADLMAARVYQNDSRQDALDGV